MVENLVVVAEGESASKLFDFLVAYNKLVSSSRSRENSTESVVMGVLQAVEEQIHAPFTESSS